MDNVEIKELLEAKLSGFKAEIRAGNDMQTYKLDRLIEAIGGQTLVAELSDDGLAIKVERGNQLLSERNY